MFIRYCFFSLLFVFIRFISLGQDLENDSLKNLLDKTKYEDTTRVHLLNTIAIKYSETNSNLSIQYAKEALTLSKKIIFKRGILRALNILGKDYYYQGNYSQAIAHLLKALKLCEGETCLADIYNWLGNVYSMHENNYSLAENYYLQSLKLRKELNEERNIAESLFNLGVLYRLRGAYQKSLDCYYQSLVIEKKLQDKIGIASTLNSIGNVYKDQNDFGKAEEYFTEALKIFEIMGQQEGIATILLNLGVMFNEIKKHEKAYIYLEKSIKIFRAINIKDGEMECSNGLALTYALLNNYEKAYQYHQLYSQIKDTLFNEESNKQISEMQTKYETEKKEQQIKLLNKDKEIQTKDLQRQKTIRNAVAGFLLLVIGFLFVLINRFVLIRKQKKVIEAERTKSEKLLLNILPKATADELKFHNKVVPKSYEMVTVMFTDFKGFTTIAEKMSAEELVSELDFIFKKFDEIISKYPIEKIKTIGDAYMCAGGIPVTNTTNPMDVVLAGLEIQEWMKAQNKWQLRLGIHTGNVIAGVVGDKKFAYDIWGDAVNTASRMESSGETGMVNISGATYKWLGGVQNFNSLRFTFRGNIPVKNKGEIEMYFVEKIM